MKFQKTEIDFTTAGSLPALVADYITGKKTLQSLFAFPPDPDGLTKAMAHRQLDPGKRKILTEVLREQHADSGAEVKQNIEALLDPGTYTVTTGHQLNLFTGPLFFVYKVLSAIHLAEFLRREHPEKKFVPVYWMASEDHDLEEIDHAYLFGKKIQWTLHGSGAAGRISCEGMSEVLDELKQVLGDSDRARQIWDMAARAYREDATLAQATRSFVSGMFGRYGLVILDGDDKRLKDLFKPVMKEELKSRASFQEVNKTIAVLKESGYEAQVHPREINLFYLEKNLRERITFGEGRYQVLNSTKNYSEEEILAELDEHPENFSPNVVLRPLYQETVLPNIAYIGGPAEIAYWLEYYSLFQRFSIPFPILALRNSALILDENTQERMKKLQLSEADLFKSTDALTKAWVQQSPDSFTIAEEVARLGSVYDELARKAGLADPTLMKLVEGEKQKQANALKALEEKMIRAVKKKNETSVQQIEKLKERLFPGGTFQERRENMIPHFLKYGDGFFDGLLEQFSFPVSHFLVIREWEAGR